MTNVGKQYLVTGIGEFGNIEFIVELPGHGDIEHVEVSSGGRRWAIAGIAFLLCIVAGVVVFTQMEPDATSDTPVAGADSKKDSNQDSESEENLRFGMSERASGLKRSSRRLKS